MNAVAFVDALRERFLDRLAANLRGARVPGGDLVAWVAPLPTAALVEVLLHPASQTRALLFATVGAARLQTVAIGDQDLFSGAHDNVPLGDTAQAALMAWSTCRIAREYLDVGLAQEAQSALIGVTRSIHLWPTPIARRFEPRIESLYADAERMRARQLAQEVA